MGASKFDFLIEAIKNWKQSGAITQSGENLCKGMVEHIDDSTKFIVELGAGDGVITKHILEKAPKDAIILSFEINEKLYEKLININDERLIPIYDSAENLSSYLNEYEIKSVDTIVSSIPFVVLPTEITINILEVSKSCLKKGGLFVQFHYSKVLKDLYQTVFSNYETNLILKNAPPAFIFKCKKL
jgi:phospholipid N-methyltransferase